VAAEVRGHFPGRVYSAVIPRSVRLSEAPSYGQPVALYDPRSKGSLAYRALALEVAGVEDDEASESPPDSEKEFEDASVANDEWEVAT
jgi:MinD-like ATPase involved in chromosome partitioning or flagellar assembly